MGQVTVTAQRMMHAPAERVRTALADYVDIRPKILTDHYSEYVVHTGGRGVGTQVHWKLAATEKRVRDQIIRVTEPADAEQPSLVESDRNSSMVTTWTVAPASEAGTSTVKVHTTWNGASGIGGFFERMFAPLGLRKIHDGMLANLDGLLRKR